MAAKKLTLKQLKAKVNKTNKTTGDFDNIVSQLKAGLMRDFTVEEACHAADIHRNTYYNWIAICDEFAEDMEKAKSYAFRAAKKVLMDSIIDDKDPANSKWLLERRQKKQYAPGTTMLGDEENPLIIKVKDFGDNDTTTTEAEGSITEIV